jgi:hypothetical protein
MLFAALSVVIARLDRAIRYSRDGGGTRIGRGVLDSPPSRGMTAEFGETSCPLGKSLPVGQNRVNPTAVLLCMGLFSIFWLGLV